MRVIALEEHFLTESIAHASSRHREQAASRMMDTMTSKLLDLDAGRLAAMDTGRVDVQVLSVVAHEVDAADEPALTRDANDQLAAAVARHPDRFSGFALLPMRTPDAAAVEFERAVGRLGFKGAMISGTVDGKFLDVGRLHASLGCLGMARRDRFTRPPPGSGRRF